ncbi:MAG: T9SS type A sorting domain-containing protein [Bacteroidota bacterium]
MATQKTNYSKNTYRRAVRSLVAVSMALLLCAANSVAAKAKEKEIKNPQACTAPVITGTATICAGSATTLSTSYVLGANETYLWSDNSTGATLNAVTAGNYSLRIVNAVTPCTSAASNVITTTINTVPTPPTFTTGMGTSSTFTDNSGPSSVNLSCKGLKAIPGSTVRLYSSYDATSGYLFLNRISTIGNATFSPDGNKLAVSEYSSNRVVIYNTLPTSGSQVPDVAIGQTSVTGTTAGTSATQLSAPYGMTCTPDGKLLIADYNNNRVLVYYSIPTASGSAADLVLGQTSFTTATAATGASGLDHPTAIAVSPDGKLLVTEGGNRRTLVWNTFPTANGQAADVVIGQPDFATNSAGVTASKFSVCNGVSVNASGKLAIVDRGNARILIYNSIPTVNGADADVVIGKANFTSSAGACFSSSFLSPGSVCFTPEGKLLTIDEGCSKAPGFGTAPCQKANLFVSITSSSTASCATGTITYTVTVTNPGAYAVPDVAVGTGVPARLSFVSSSATTGAYNSAGDTWTIPSVPAGGSAVLTLTATVPASLVPQSLTAYAGITGVGYTETDYSNNGASVTLYVVPTPGISAGSTANLCPGGSVVLTSSAIAGGTWLWSTGAATQSITVSTASNPTVRFVSATGCTSAASAALPVTITSTPTISGTAAICSGSTTSLSTSYALGANEAYLWSNNSSGATLTTGTVGTYSLRIRNTVGCTSAASNTITVSTIALPATPAITGSGTVCAGAVTTLSTSRTLGANEAYLWSDNSSASNLTTGLAGSYTLRIRNTGTGCTSAASNAITVSLTALPSAPVITGTESICAGSTTTLSTSYVLGANEAYLWSNTSTGSTITTGTAGISYSLRVRNTVTGCTSAVSNVITTTLNTTPAAPAFTTGMSYSATANITSPGSVAISSKGIKAAGGLDFAALYSSADAVTPYLTLSRPSSRMVRCTFSPDGSKLLLSEPGNNRVVIYNTLPVSASQVPDVVIGQTSLSGTGAGVSSTQLNNPYGIFVTPGGRLLIADASNYRVLVYNTIPTANNAAADLVVGQPDFSTSSIGNAADKLGIAYGVTCSPAGKLIVSNSSCNRVHVWNTIPTTNGRPADVVIGQANLTTASSGTTDAKMYYPFEVTCNAKGRLAVTELGNQRILLYDSVPASNGAVANAVLGQPDFSSSTNGSGPAAFNAPCGAAFTPEGRFWAADQYNNRVSVYGSAPCQFSNLSVSISASAASVCAGSSITYTVTVTNPAAYAVPGTVIGAGVPAVFTYVSSSMSGGTYNSAGSTWTIPSLAAGATATLTVTGNIPFSAAGQTVKAYAAITGTAYTESDYSDNGSSAAVTVITTPVPTVTGVAEICAGSTTTLSAGYVLGANEAYLWSNNSSASTLTTAVAGTYSLRIRNTVTGCTSAAGNVITTTINTTPTAPAFTNGMSYTSTLACSKPLEAVISSKGIKAIGGNEYVALYSTPDATTPYLTLNRPGVDIPKCAFSPDGNKLIIPESNSNRVVVYNSLPITGDQAPDVVIGQTSMSGSNFGISATLVGRPFDISVTNNGRLLITDITGNRILVYNTIPTVNGAAADLVLGQANFTSTSNSNSAVKMNYPNGVTCSPEGKLIAGSSGDNRVLVWNTFPVTNGQPADVVIGQPNFTTYTSGLSAAKMYNPSGVATDATGRLAVSDNSNSRVLLYNSIPTANGASADIVLGQPDFTSNGVGVGPAALIESYGLNFTADGRLLTDDYYNNRVLTFGVAPCQLSNLSVSISASAASLCAGSSLTYTVTVTNPAAYAVPGTVIGAGVPAVFTYVSSFASTGSYNSAGSSWTIPSLAAGATETLTFTGNIPVSAKAGNLIAYAAIAGTGFVETDYSNNGASAAVTVIAAPATPTITPGSSVAVCTGGSIVLTCSAIAGGSCLWSTGEVTQSITVSSASSLTVRTIGASGCTSAASTPVIVTITPLQGTPSVPAFITALSPAAPLRAVSGGSTAFTSAATNAVSYTYAVTGSGNSITNAGVATWGSGFTGTATVTVTAWGCTGAGSSNSVSVMVSAPGTWWGYTDGSWANPANWAGGLPSASKDISISTLYGSSQPAITGTANVRNVAIAAGASLSVASGATLNISGDATVSGTFSPSAGSTVNFSGNDLQSLPSAFYGNLSINSSGGAVLSGNASVSGILNLGSSSTLNLNGKDITINGTVSGSGTVRSTSASNLNIGGSGNMGSVNFTDGSALNNLTMNRSSSGYATLGSNLSVIGVLTVTQGILSTGSNRITLGSNASLLGESDNAYVFGSIEVTHNTLQNVTDTYGNIGVVITAKGANPGNTYVLRNIGTDVTGYNMSHGLKRRYTITPANDANLDATFIFRYLTGTNELNNLGTSNLTLYKSTNSGLTWLKVDSCFIDASAKTITAKHVNSFSDWAAADKASPLPVTLLNFTGNMADGRTVLRWSTANENNNLGFTILRSNHCQADNFEKRGFVPGAGNSFSVKDYTFIDSLNSADAYYQLLQTDYNGKRELSPVIHVGSRNKPAADWEALVYPNPIQGSAGISIQSLSAETINVEVLTANGERVHQNIMQLQPGLNLSRIDFSALPSAVYFIKLQSAAGVKVLRAVKE